MTRRTTIIVERHEITLNARSEDRLPVYCERCRAEVSGLKAVEISFRPSGPMIEPTDDAHFVETREGRLSMICGGPTDI